MYLLSSLCKKTNVLSIYNIPDTLHSVESTTEHMQPYWHLYLIEFSDVVQCSAKVTRAAGPTQCVLSLKGSVGRVQSAASCLTMLHSLLIS